MASLIHATAHGLNADDAFKFGNIVPVSGTGVDDVTTYYVLASGLTADAFQFSTTIGGTAFVLSAAITDGVVVRADPYQTQDGLRAAVAEIAVGVEPLAITETMIADDAISTPKLQANSITANKLAATLILASLIKTADTGRRIEIDNTGIRLYDSSEVLLVNIPTNGDPVYVKGQVNAASLISEASAELRGVASLAGSGVMTLQNGVASPTNPPTLVASLDSLALTSTPPNLGYGICYDSAGGAGGATPSYWIGADPSVSNYVAHEYNASTGALIRSILKTDTLTEVTTTLGSTSHVGDTWEASSGSTNSQIATPLTMPRAGRIRKVSIYARGYNGACDTRVAIWDTSGNLLRDSVAFSMASETPSAGGANQYNKDLDAELSVASGVTIWAGWLRESSGDGFWWDRDGGSGKTTKKGDGLTGDMTSIATDSSNKPNVYITYDYDVGSNLEGYTGKIVGVARQGTYIWVLESTGILYKYNQADLTYVSKTDVSANLTGTEANNGLFWDGTYLVVTMASATGAGAAPRFARFNTSAVHQSTLTGSTLSIDGTTATLRGGYYDGSLYWCPINGVAYAFTASTGADNANKDFGTTASAKDGLTHDGTQFRGWAVATPTKVWKFTNWDWTTASAVYWVGYAWYDSAGTTHETAIGPRSSITMRRRERLQVTTPAIPVGGAEDPDKVRVYMLPNATDPTAGSFKRQAEDALTARYLTTYDSGGGADGAGTAFPAGSPAELRSAVATGSGGWSLKGDGSFIWKQGTAFPSSPATNDRFYRTDLGEEFFWNGTYWLSTSLYSFAPASYQNAGVALSATNGNIFRATPPIPSAGFTQSVYIEEWGMGYNLAAGTGPNSTNKWELDWLEYGSGTLIDTLVIDSGAEGAWVRVSNTVDAVVTETELWNFNANKTGTPGNLTFNSPTIFYRLMAT